MPRGDVLDVLTYLGEQARASALMAAKAKFAAGEELTDQELELLVELERELRSED